MNRIVPIVIVIGGCSVPAAIVRFERVMRPAHSRVCAGNHNILSGVAQRPYLRGVSVIDPGLDQIRPLELRTRLNNSTRLRQVVLNVRIAFYLRHVGPAGQRFRDFAAAFHQNRVHDIEGAIFKPVFAQPLPDRSLRGLALVQQRVVNVPPLLSLRVQGRGLA